MSGGSIMNAASSIMIGAFNGNQQLMRVAQEFNQERVGSASSVQ